VIKEIDLIDPNHGSAAEHAGTGKDPKGRNTTLHCPELVCNVFPRLFGARYLITHGFSTFEYFDLTPSKGTSLSL
jgi:hypothetical protein